MNMMFKTWNEYEQQQKKISEWVYIEEWVEI